MNKFLLLLYVLLSILSFTFAQEDPGRNKPALMKELPTQEITTLVDNLMNDYMKQDLFSGAVLVAKDREPVYLKAFGKADSENDRDNRTDTKFDIGSINKDFTSVAILQLVGKGKLKLDDNIGKYLNQFPKEVLDKVTIRQLLTHTSGFGDYFMIPGVIQKLKDLTTIDKIINTFKDQPLLFEPGTDREYSNAGYAVLGAVIESVSGMSYFDYIDKNILKPANLSNTYFDYRTIRNDNEIPAGYMFSSTGKRIRVDYEKTPSPAGSGFSTVEDLLKFQLSLLYDNKLLGDNMKVLLASEFKNESGKNWRDILADSAYISALAGGAPGRNSVIYCQPVSGYIIIVLANYDEPVAEDVGRKDRKSVV